MSAARARRRGGGGGPRADSAAAARGLTALVVLSVLTGPALAGRGPRWDTGGEPIRLCLHLETLPGASWLTRWLVLQRARAAARLWSAAGCAAPRLEVAECPGVPDVRRADGRSSIAWSPRVPARDRDGGQPFSSTARWLDAAEGGSWIVEADIALTAAVRWGGWGLTLARPPAGVQELGAADLAVTLAHEIGHLLGLGHHDQDREDRCAALSGYGQAAACTARDGCSWLAFHNRCRSDPRGSTGLCASAARPLMCREYQAGQDLTLRPADREGLCERYPSGER